MDLVTSLPQTAAGYDAVFIVIDRFSKLVKLKPCTSTIGATELAQLFMDQIVCINGDFLRKIISDHYPPFLSTFWIYFNELVRK